MKMRKVSELICSPEWTGGMDAWTNRPIGWPTDITPLTTPVAGGINRTQAVAGEQGFCAGPNVRFRSELQDVRGRVFETGNRFM